MGFPTQVNVQPAIGVAGDFASANPRVSVVNQAGAFVAGALGCVVGRFAWADAANITLSNTGAGAPTGFIGRFQQALITAFLGETSSLIPQGMAMTAFSEGDFFAKNEGAAAATRGMKAYADNATGKVSFAATGAPPTGASILGANQTIVANVFVATLAANSMTASIALTVMTVSAIGSGTVLFPGQTVAGAGVNPATTIVNQLTGTTGAAGTYTVSVSQTIVSEAMTATGGGMTITAHTSGALLPGQVITGTGIPAGTTVVGYGTMATPIAAAGTVAISVAPTPASGITVTGDGAYLTVATAITGVIALNDTVLDATTPGNMPAGTYVKNFITGVGGLGTYMLNAAGATSATAEALTIPGATETKWYAMTAGAVGELVKISAYRINA